MEVQVAQLLQGRVLAADLVEPAEQQVEVLPAPSAAAQSRGRYWNFSESRYSSRPGPSGAFSNSSKPE